MTSVIINNTTIPWNNHINFRVYYVIDNYLVPYTQCVVVVKFGSQLTVQSVHITTKVASSNPVNGNVYFIQHYVC